MAKQLKTSVEGRKCMFMNCKHVLSIYNHEAYCHVHRDQAAKVEMSKTPYRQLF